jgi:hypothetical protein
MVCVEATLNSDDAADVPSHDSLAQEHRCRICTPKTKAALGWLSDAAYTSQPIEFKQVLAGTSDSPE